MSDKQKITDSEHPEFKAGCEKWERFLLSYRGGAEYARSVMTMHPREDADEYAARLKRCYPDNYSQKMVDIRTSYLVKEEPKVECPSAVEDYTKDLDRRGSDISAIVSRVGSESQTMGTSVIVIDRPQLNQDVLTKADQDRIGDRPYFQILPPTMLQNFGKDERGEIEWALIRQAKSGSSISVESGAPVVVETPSPDYILWTREAYYLLDDKGNVIDEGVNPIGVVPVVLIPFKLVSDDDYGTPLLNDIEPLGRRIIENWSLLDSILHNQTFSILTVEGGIEPEKGLDPNGKPIARKKKISTTSALEYNEGGNAPSFISPDASQASLILGTIEALETKIYRHADLQRSAVKEGGQIASGASKAYDFIDTNHSLRKQAAMLSSGLSRALWIFGRWLGLKDDEEKYSVTFPDDFGVETAGELVAEYKELCSTTDPPPNIIRQHLLQMYVDRRFRELPEEERSKIKKKIKDELTGDWAAVPEREPDKPETIIEPKEQEGEK